MCEEEQKDELDALRSIYEGDSCFSEISGKCFQYKFGAEGSGHSFLLQIEWSDTYPTDSCPQFNLELFYNHHLLPDVKGTLKNPDEYIYLQNLRDWAVGPTTYKSIVSRLHSESEALLGMAATFTLIEFVKENLADLLEDQPEEIQIKTENDEKSDSQNICEKEKKVALTKAQKRKLWDRGEANEDKPRGYNWVDIVKHLSQTGSQQS